MDNYLMVFLPVDTVDSVKRHQSLFGKKYSKKGKSYEYPGLLSTASCERVIDGVYKFTITPEQELITKLVSNYSVIIVKEV